MDVSMSVCRVGPVGLGRGGCSGVGFMANFVRSRILVCRGYVYCCGLICVVVFGCMMKPAHVNSVYAFHGSLNRE